VTYFISSYRDQLHIWSRKRAEAVRPAV